MIEFRQRARIAPGHPCLPGHFPGNPIVPAVVLLERVEQALRAALGPGVRLRALPSVKFLNPLAPGVEFDIRLEIDGAAARFQCQAEGRELAAGRLEYVRD